MPANILLDKIWTVWIYSYNDSFLMALCSFSCTYIENIIAREGELGDRGIHVYFSTILLYN